MFSWPVLRVLAEWLQLTSTNSISQSKTNHKPFPCRRNCCRNAEVTITCIKELRVLVPKRRTLTAPSTSLSSRTASAASYSSTGAQKNENNLPNATAFPQLKYPTDVNFCRSFTNRLHRSLPNSFQPPFRANNDGTGRNEVI